jgi:hypothetical protein
MKSLPIAKTELEKIVNDNSLYVDKTKFIKELIDDKHGYYFLSRPRRFGKSLFIDTLRAAFAGEKDLFKGLYLENNWDWTVNYPVIKISFGGGTVTNSEELKLTIEYTLEKNANEYGVELTKKFNPNKFDELIIKLYEKFNQQVVILVDEYDKPILDNITKETVDTIREQLSSFYSVLKDASPYLKFVFLTGVSRFSKTSIFSKLNNLTDISLVPKYADICGITQQELESTFAEYLDDVDLEKVKRWYDGYSFRGSKLYNPYDVLRFLWEKEFKPYWFETGTPTFLLELIKQNNYYIPKLEQISISGSQLSEFELDKIELEVLLFQTGYLTIKAVRQLGTKYYYDLVIPNIEVKTGLMDYLFRMFYAKGTDANERSALCEKIYMALYGNNPDGLHTAFHSFFSSIPPEWYRKNNIAHFEGFYNSMFYAVFAGLGEDMVGEDTTNKGRIDLTVKTPTSVFIFEFKMKQNPKNALQQIKEKKYHEKYLAENKDIFLIGIEFDEEEKNISNFEWEKVGVEIL